MSNDTIYTKNNGIFQEFLFLLGHLAHNNLMRQIDFLKTENKILRSKLGKRVNVSASEKQQLIKYGLPLNGSIKYFLSIVCYSTFRKWVTNGVVTNPKNKTNRGRRMCIPEHIDHPFRSTSTTHSGPHRPLIPDYIVHLNQS